MPGSATAHRAKCGEHEGVYAVQEAIQATATTNRSPEALLLGIDAEVIARYGRTLAWQIVTYPITGHQLSTASRAVVYSKAWT